jgi:ribosomal protein L11 methyltransferase
MASLMIAMDEPETDRWMEIRVPVGAADPGEIAGMLPVERHAAGVELRAGTVVLWVHESAAAAAAADVTAAVACLAAAGVALDAGAVAVVPGRPEAEWRDAWKRHFTVTRVSPHLVIVPSWERHRASAGDVVLHLDPGRAFGTGAHASTRLCLAEIDALARGSAGRRAVRRVLDCGTGSGILAIAIAKLWPASHGIAIDVDPPAVEVAEENARRNAVGDRIECSLRAAGEVPGPFDLVVANVERAPLLALRDALVSSLGPGATLVLSGITADEVPALLAAYTATGALRALRTPRLVDDLEWSAVVLAAL